MRLYLVISLLFTALQVTAQNRTFDAIEPEVFENGGVQIFSEAGINSNTFTGDFYTGLLDGRLYTNETLNNITNRAGMHNRAGFDSHTGFQTAIKLNPHQNDNVLLTIGGGFKTHLNSAYSRDALNVFLNGNSNYRSREADFDDLNAKYLEYSKIKVGLHKRTSTGKRLGVTAAINLGHNLFALDAPFARLYTPENGSDLRFNLLAEAHYTDETDKNRRKIKGVGAGLDFYYEIPLNLTAQPENKGYLRTSIHDFGFITYNQNTKNAQIDSLYYYSGEDAGTFPQQNGEAVSLLTAGEARDLITTQTENVSKTVILPFWLRARAFQQFKKYDVSAGIDFRVNANFTPYLYTRLRRFLGESWKAGAILGAGGYGNGNFGLSFSYERAGWGISLISQNLDGILFSSTAGGVHGGIQLQKCF